MTRSSDSLKNRARGLYSKHVPIAPVLEVHLYHGLDKSILGPGCLTGLVQGKELSNVGQNVIELNLRKNKCF